MRTFTYALVLTLGSLAATGCKWTEFDDLEDSTWVSSQTTPSSVDSADYGALVVRGRLSGDAAGAGSTTVVISASHFTYSELVYTSAGKGSVPFSGIKLDSGIYSLPSFDGTQVAASPSNSDVAIAVNDGTNGLGLAVGTDAPNLTIINGPTVVGGLAYFVTTAGSPAVPVVAGTVGTSPAISEIFNGTNVTLPCKLVDGANASINFTAIAPIRGTPAIDGLVVLTKPTTGSAQLLIYPPAALATCAATGTPIAPVVAALDTGLDVTAGAQLRILDDVDATTGAVHEYAVIGSFGDAGQLGLYDLGDTAADAATRVPTVIGAPIPAAGLASIDLGNFGGLDYVVAGYPTASIDGTVTGEVQVSEIITTAAAPATAFKQPADMVLSDAQPSTDETFGRSVAVVPFGFGTTSPIIVVAAHGEVFTYLHTALYPDVRTN